MSNVVPIIPYLVEADSNDKIFYTCHEIVSQYPLHGHDAYELELVYQGKGRQWINGTLYPMSQGSMYLLTSRDIHRIETDSPIRLISIKFLPEIAGMLGIGDVQSAYIMQLEPDDYSRLCRFALSVIDEKGKNLKYEFQRTLAVTSLLLVHLLRNGMNNMPSPPGKQFTSAMEYIQDHYADPNLRLKDVAAVSGFSQCYFSTSFNHAVGCSFSSYLTKYRLYCACSLLANHNLSITEIAYDVGFSSLPHFFRVFKEVYKCTPLQYRNGELDCPVPTSSGIMNSVYIEPAPVVQDVKAMHFRDGE